MKSFALFCSILVLAMAGCDEPIPGETNCDLCPGTCVDEQCVAADVTADSGDSGTDAEDDVSTDPSEDASSDPATDAVADVDQDGAEDAVEEDTDASNDTEPDAEEDAEPDAEEDAEADADAGVGFGMVITTPRDEFSAETGREVLFSADVSPGAFAPEDLTATWTSDLDGLLFEANVEAEGITQFTTSELSVGIHQITLTVYSPEAELSAIVHVGVCGWLDAATFDDGLPEEWVTYNDATRDPRGWLEMTGSTRDRRGAIANVGRSVAGGDVRMRFRVATGQCDAIGPCADTGTPGADGFALSVFEVPDVATLEEIIRTAQAGGGLGYGIAGGWGSWSGEEVDAFHIEFDTWYNLYNGSTEFHTDPTRENHIAITLNGNPGDHVAWAEAPSLEDNGWHDMEVIIEGAQVVVIMDGAVVIDEDVPGLNFKGGYVVFTGSTGYFYNFHRFDELQVIEDCRFD